MRAHVLTRYGKTNDVLSLRDWSDAELGEAQVRVAVRAAAINPVDLKTREGEPKLLLPFAPPFVLGVDLAGTVTEVGPRVSSLRVGDEVFTHTGMDRMGAFAERVVLDESRVARAPASSSPLEAACLPLPGLCARAALAAGDVREGTRVLVHGGLGGVGSLAVQLAKARGAEVFATVAGEGAERARALGVAHPIDYGRERFEEVAREMDFVLDTVGGDTLRRSWSCVRRGGTLASLHVPPPADALVQAGLRAGWLLRTVLPLASRGARVAAKKAGARLVPILAQPDAAGLVELAALADAAGVQVQIARTLPFSALGTALDLVASGKAKGRVVLEVV